MTYTILGQDLHETADHAKRYFSTHHAASRFVCEQAVDPGLPLRPTWNAQLKNKYVLCVEVRDSPYSESLHQFVNLAVSRGLPIKLWVAVPQRPASATFSADLKTAKTTGVGVVSFSESGEAVELLGAVPLSLAALRRTDPTKIPRPIREEVMSAEKVFLNGNPGLGCQGICQLLEAGTRRFARKSYDSGWWKKKGGKSHDLKFFEKDPWANVLRELEANLDVAAARKVCSKFDLHVVVRTRGFTDLRNTVSHKPSTAKQLLARDQRLRTMFESTRDILAEVCAMVAPIKLFS